MSRIEQLSEFRRDVGYALRTLRRAPGFTAVAVVTLGLGIGANSTIFSVVKGVLLESLPFQAADQLYDVQTLYPDGTGYSLSPPDFMSIREENRVFERVEAYYASTFTLLGAGEPKQVRGAAVSDGLFQLLGLPVAQGRGFLPEENQPGQARVAVLDHGFWQREFGGDRSVLGRTLVVGGDPYEIVGVLAAGARLPVNAEMYAPQVYDERFSATASAGRRGESLRVVGRAQGGASPERIEADLRRVGTMLQSAFPETNATLTFSATSLRETIVGDVRTPLLVLLGAVGFVLLVACANVANLLLARSSSRQAELAVRAALGAGRGRLLRQLLTEAVVLGLAGGALGLLTAYGATRALVSARPADIPRLDEIGVDGTVLLFTLAVGLLTGLAFGAAPALQATGARLMGTLREGGRGGSDRAGHRIRAGLVVTEMALAVVLLTGAGLLIRSFVELTRVDAGFDAEHAVTFRLTLQGGAYEGGEQIRNRVDELHERLRGLPGVTAVGASTTLPLSGRGAMWYFAVIDAPPPPPDVNTEIAVVRITPGYFEAIGTRLLHGRVFTDRDHADAPQVALVNEAAVRRWFGGEDPVGRRVDVNGEREIVGVVSDVLHGDPGEPAVPQLYAPFAQSTPRSLHFVVRTTGDLLAQASAIRAEVRALDSDLPIAELMPLEQVVTSSVARPRFYTSLLALFAAVGLTLAATGIFGVMSYTVAQRTREIGIRMALGARAAGVIRMIVGRAMAMAATGAVIGIAAALALGRVLESQLFGVSIVDPITLGAVVVVLSATAAAASYLPARRAAGLDPGRVLRSSG